MVSDLAMVLAEMVDTDNGIRDVLQDAGLNSVQVNMQGSPFQMWRSALDFAEQSHALPSVLSVMRGRFPQSTQLFDAEVRYWSSQQLRPQGVQAPDFQRDMANVQSILAGLNVRLMYMERDGQQRSNMLNKVEREASQEWVRIVYAIILAAVSSSFMTVLMESILNRYP